jgi:hypothetical protein
MMSPDIPPSQARAWPHDTGGGGYAPQLRYPPLPGRDPALPPRGSRATYNAEGHHKEEGRELQPHHNNGALYDGRELIYEGRELQPHHNNGTLQEPPPANHNDAIGRSATSVFVLLY